MSRNQLLASLGVFVRPAFLGPGACASLNALMIEAPAEPAAVYIGGAPAEVDQQARRALSVDPPAEVCAGIERALDDLRADLERHFGTPLATREPPHYLVYGEGAFFIPHRDRPRLPGPASEVADRKISVVLFLSAPQATAGGGYEGGELRFYGLIEGPEWKDVGLGCDAVPGLLLAFRADTLHEVSPVTAGRRCVIVTWFG